MLIIIGLGNPGRQYQKTPHNLGFRVLDYFKKKQKFSNFVFSKKYNSLISKGEIGKKKIILGKPKTFINNSGKAVKLLVKDYFKKKENNQELKNLWVIHDDIDLSLGKIKIVKNQGSGGHKGVKSIIDELKTKNFIRFKIGTQPKFGKPKNIKNFVLKNFNQEEEKIVKEIIKKIKRAIDFSLKEGLEKAMNEFNK